MYSYLWIAYLKQTNKKKPGKNWFCFYHKTILSWHNETVIFLQDNYNKNNEEMFKNSHVMVLLILEIFIC